MYARFFVVLPARSLAPHTATACGIGRPVTLRRAAVAWGLAASLLCGCLWSRVLYHNAPSLDAPTLFDARVVPASRHPIPLVETPDDARFILGDLTDTDHAHYASFDDLLEENDTHAFLVLHDDAIVYERYFDGDSKSTEFPAFSMSKSFASLLVERAVADGLFRSLDQPIVELVPELRERPGYPEVTLEELVRMNSGIDFDEESVDGAALYYSHDLRDRMYEYDVKWKPGEHYLYGSVGIMLLWDALHRRLGGRTVADYFAEKVWDPLGAESPASWSLDSEESGIEKFFGGFNATARDQARLGLLFLHRGEIDGKELVSKTWVAQSIYPDPVPGIVRTSDGLVKRGYYQWFLTLDGRAYFAKGYHGQYVFVVPEKNLVFVRFGDGYGDVDWPSLFLRLADGL